MELKAGWYMMGMSAGRTEAWRPKPEFDGKLPDELRFPEDYVLESTAPAEPPAIAHARTTAAAYFSQPMTVTNMVAHPNGLRFRPNK